MTQSLTPNEPKHNHSQHADGSYGCYACLKKSKLEDVRPAAKQAFEELRPHLEAQATPNEQAEMGNAGHLAFPNKMNGQRLVAGRLCFCDFGGDHVEGAVRDTSDQANTSPHSELAPQTTPSKADIRAAIAEALKEAFGMTYIDPNSRPMAVLEKLITTNLTQAILPHEPGDLDKQVDAWLRKNNVGVNQFAEFVGIFAWMNAEVSNRAIAHALTQYDEALLAKLPEKHKFTDKPRNTIHAMANEAEVNGFNDCLDQVATIIKGSTHD